MNFDILLKNDNPELFSTLEEGDTGNCVIILQDKLKLLDYFDTSITGSFDSYTTGSVMNFQVDQLLIPNGIVGRDTWEALYNLTTGMDNSFIEIVSRPVLKLGSTGPYVAELQTLLTNLLYYDGVIDGNFGSATQGAVKRFQANNRLTPDGIVGRDTWSALATLYSPMVICDEENNGSGTFVYTVVAGDTLWRLALRFHTTVDTIKQLNNLTSDNLSIGQQLLIPVSDGNQPPTTITYTVVAGDTVFMGNNE